MSMTATRMLARDWRGGELGVLVMALVLAVGVVSGISAFTTRLQSALEQESHRFLAADAVVRSGRDMPRQWLEEAQRRGLQAADPDFPLHGVCGGGQYVPGLGQGGERDYPLRGELTYSAEPFGEVLPAAAGPGRGEVWLDSRLFPLLDVEIGQQYALARPILWSQPRRAPSRTRGPLFTVTARGC